VHLLVKERRSLDEAEQAQDLGQTPADLVLLSFFDADLGAAAQSWSDWDRQMGAGRAPSLRLASLGRLRHPMSVDLYAEAVVGRSKAVVARVYGGLDYWAYGAEQLSAVCRAQGVPLALVAGDGCGRLDARLAALSTAPAAALDAFDGYLREGGLENLGHALRLAASLAGLCAPPTAAPQPMPDAGVFQAAPDDGRPLATLVFYRSHLASGDVAPVRALAEALEAPLVRHCAVYLTTGTGKGADPVARFHLGNGARLERINWLGNTAARGLAESWGIMVNYLYDPAFIESNHEAFVRDGLVARASAVDALIAPPAEPAPLRRARA